MSAAGGGDEEEDVLKNVQGIILAAGYGTRLGALSEERPKPLLPVCDMPLVRWVAQLFVHAGTERLAVNLHHLGDQLATALGDVVEGGRADGGVGRVPIRYAPEKEILGTGGGIREMARAAEGRTLVVANGKIVTNVDLAAVVAVHRRRRAKVTLVLAPHANARAWGAIGVDAAGSVVRFLDREAGSGGAGSGGAVEEHMFTGIHVLEPEVIEMLPSEGPCCIIRDGYLPLFERGASIAAYVHRGYFYEHSTPERYLQGNLNLVRGGVSLPARPGPLSGVHAQAEVAKDATIVGPVLVSAGAEIAAGAQVGPNVIVGAGARVGAGAHLEKSVVWPGAEVSSGATLRRAIVTSRRVVAVPPSADPWARPR